jgi:MFS family permease
MQRLVMNLGVAVGGVAAGLIASVAHPGSFTVLFLVNCATFLAYVAVLARVRAPELHPERASGTWSQVLRNRTYVAFTALNAVFMASAMAVMVELLPPFAKNVAGVSEQEVGVIFAITSLGIVLFQLPLAKLAEGRSRMRGLALMGIVWAASLLAVGAGGEWSSGTVAAAVFAGASLLFSFGESLHGVIHAPLSADLAPPQLVGRYLALASLSWQAGWIVGPAAGGFALQHAPLLLWPVAAGINLACAAWALALEPHLPERVRTTPHEPLVAGAAG